jgi:hypothetical protein
VAWSIPPQIRIVLRATPQRLKARSKQSVYRSAEALHHPKAMEKVEFFLNLLELVPLPFVENSEFFSKL